jgi:hypothetical protein
MKTMMKRSLIALTLGASALLTGCGFDSDKCIEAVSKANQMSADAFAAQSMAMLAAMKGDDAQAKGMALMWFATADKRTQMMGYGDCNRDTALAWASILVPGLSNVYAIRENSRTTRHASDNSVRMQEVNMGAVTTVSVKGMDEAGKVTIPPVYTVPLGSAQAEAAPAAPTTVAGVPVAAPAANTPAATTP